MTTELRQSATVKALVNCLVRHLIKQREATLTQVEKAGERWDSQLSGQLDQVDHALTGLGCFDTALPGEGAER